MSYIQTHKVVDRTIHGGVGETALHLGTFEARATYSLQPDGTLKAPEPQAWGRDAHLALRQIHPLDAMFVWTREHRYGAFLEYKFTPTPAADLDRVARAMVQVNAEQAAIFGARFAGNLWAEVDGEFSANIRFPNVQRAMHFRMRF